MREPDMMRYENGDTHLELALSPEMRLTIRGVIDQANPSEFLDPFFATLHSEACARRVPQVSADLSSLSFMNSSGVKSLAKWILENQRSQPSYRIRFLYAPEITWQRTSLGALAMLGKEHVVVEAAG